MIFNFKSQITIVEIPMFLFLVGSFFIFYDSGFNVNFDNQITTESFLDSVYHNSNYRNLFLQEDLNNVSITQNWSSLEVILNKIYLNYELKISNGIDSKNIFSCNSTFKKDISQRIISIDNSSNFEFRIISLGVCS